MLCQESNCKELVGGCCQRYDAMYMQFVTRRNYCPFSNYPPIEVKKEEVKRVGQQKSKKKK